MTRTLTPSSRLKKFKNVHQHVTVTVFNLQVVVHVMIYLIVVRNGPYISGHLGFIFKLNYKQV